MTLDNIDSYIRNLNSPFCLFLVGPPLSGKDTFIRSLGFSDVVIISRDDIVLELSSGSDYNSAFKSVNQKQVDKILKERILNASASSKNVIINLTNLRKKKRNSFKMKFGDNYKKLAVIFPILTVDEYEKRNQIRTAQEGKTIPLSVIDEMIKGYEPIDDSENFDKVINFKY